MWLGGGVIRDSCPHVWCSVGPERDLRDQTRVRRGGRIVGVRSGVRLGEGRCYREGGLGVGGRGGSRRSLAEVGRLRELGVGGGGGPSVAPRRRGENVTLEGEVPAIILLCRRSPLLILLVDGGQLLLTGPRGESDNGRLLHHWTADIIR